MRLLLLFAVFVSNEMFSQNLVPNSSFEIYNQCPMIGNKLYYSIGWSAPPNNDAEYYNSCSSSFYSIPYQGENFQTPHSGNAFVGMYLFNGWQWYREYCQIELSSNLEIGKIYYVEFWTNHISSLYGGRYAVNNIGLTFTNIFSDTSSNEVNSNVLYYNNVINKFGNPVIEDTANWVEINGVYKATGQERFLIIGNFKGDDETSIVDITNDTTNFQGGAYYFFDDVSVEEITVPFWSYHDTLVNYGDSVLIGPALTGLDIDWYTDNMEFISNGPGIYVSPATSRNYIAKETFNGVETEHNVYVTVTGGVGLAENTLQKIEVYPNPSKGDFSISGIKNESPLQLEVRDVHSKLVFENHNLSKELNSFSLNVEDGIYFVNVIDLETKEVLVKKLIIRN